MLVAIGILIWVMAMLYIIIDAYGGYIRKNFFKGSAGKKLISSNDVESSHEREHLIRSTDEPNKSVEGIQQKQPLQNNIKPPADAGNQKLPGKGDVGEKETPPDKPKAEGEKKDAP